MTKTVGKGKFIFYAIIFLWMSVNYTWAIDILIDYQGFLKDAGEQTLHRFAAHVF